ncbi:MAG: helix-turn-helix domain-containing protein [Chloroflexota bacterium]|nr:helix-turn-helix domain-containing protein [Chloroflexota bacterium]
MVPDFDACYRAVRSRDARFDGRFFTAVTSTGVYCRPICPAPLPLAANTRFYACAAAAEAAGFRACRRCRPETAPGSPAWNTRADVVARALRLIAEGVVDVEGVVGLGRRLAVSERQLHRALVAEVGVGPLALARSRRARTAHLLIDQTAIPLTAVSGAAGFASIRQFNDTMRAAFGRSPTELRRRVPAAPDGGALVLRFPYRPPLDSDTLLSYLAYRAIPGVEEVIDGRYRRTVALPRSRGIIELEPLAGAHTVALRLCLDDLRDLSLVAQRCRGVFDLDADPAAIEAVLGADALLAPLVAARPGLRVPGSFDGFELAVRAILGQQVSVAGARTLAGRLVAALGEPLAEPRGALTHLFPTPERLAGADLQGLGLTRGRVVALQALARAIVAGGLTLDRGADWEQTTARLRELPGIGPWTASYIAMRALGDPDACPVADLGLRRALERRGLAGDPKSIAARAEAWRPWRAYATHHLWASLATS